MLRLTRKINFTNNMIKLYRLFQCSKRFLANYLILVGFLVHIALVGALILYPDIRYGLEKKLVALFNEPVTSGMDIAGEIRIAYGSWSPLQSSLLAPNKVLIGSREFVNLQTAVEALKPGDILELGPGVYKTPLIIKHDRITLIGRGHVVFDGPAAEDKAAIVVKGNNFRINNIECTGIKVSDLNGACIRFEGVNLNVEHVYFHNSEQGILTGDQPGIVTIRDSRFELLGRNGRAHGIYIGGGELHIEDSLFIAAVDEGHEIKSRARVTEIVRTSVASLVSGDSRLIDISNGGLVSIRNSVLEKGPGSSNADLIGYGLEGMKYSNNYIELKNNIIIMERNGSNNLINKGASHVLPVVDSNIVISNNEADFGGFNIWHKSRKKAGIDKYPYIPSIN